MVISLKDRMSVAALGESGRDPPKRETPGRSGVSTAESADVVELPVQNQHHTLRFIAPDDGHGNIAIQIIDERSGRVVRQIPWDVAGGISPGSLLSYRI